MKTNTLTPKPLRSIDPYWCAANHLSVAKDLSPPQSTVEATARASEEALRHVFIQLNCQRALVEGNLLKPNIAPPCLIRRQQGSDEAEADADATAQCLVRNVPAATPGIEFLSGGQSAELASALLNAMNRRFKSRAPWTLSFFWQRTGSTDIPLSTRGEDEARRLARRLRDVSFARGQTCPLVRARRTCELAVPNADPQIETDLAEWNYGDYEGLGSLEMVRKRPGWNLCRDGGPNGETPAQISGRSDRLIARLSGFEGDVAFFYHGHFGRVLAARWIGLPVTEGQRFQLGATSIRILDYDRHHPEAPINVTRNSTSPADLEPGNTRAIERWENEGGEIPGPPPPLAAGKPPRQPDQQDQDHHEN